MLSTTALRGVLVKALVLFLVAACGNGTSQPTEDDARKIVEATLVRFHFDLEIVDFKKTNGIPRGQNAYDLQFELVARSRKGKTCTVSGEVEFILSENGWISQEYRTPIGYMYPIDLDNQGCSQSMGRKATANNDSAPPTGTVSVEEMRKVLDEGNTLANRITLFQILPYFYDSNGEFPNSNSEVELGEPTSFATEYISEVAIMPGGVLRVTFNAERLGLAGDVMIVRTNAPMKTPSGDILSTTCDVTIASEYVDAIPQFCIDNPTVN